MEDGQKHHYVSNRFSGKRREYKHIVKLRKWKEAQKLAGKLMDSD
jgi:hypothetical protein